MRPLGTKAAQETSGLKVHPLSHQGLLRASGSPTAVLASKKGIEIRLDILAIHIAFGGTQMTT